MGIERTLYFCLNSLLNGDDIILRRIWDGAVKCLARFLRLEDVTFLLNFILSFDSPAYD